MRRGQRLLLAVLALLAGACGGSAKAPPSRLPAEGDALILQQVFEGTLAPQAGLDAVARSQGWPIATSQGYLFAVLDVGLGPYLLTSPSGGFADTPMRSEAGVAWVLLAIAAPDGVSYRVTTRFGPLTEAQARRVTSDGPGLLGLVASSAPHRERWPFPGNALVAARRVQVWVPALPPTHFLYAHDGQNLLDAAGPYGGWRLDLAAGPATLVVAVENTPARMEEYTQVQDLSPLTGGEAGPYLDYVVDEILPFIEAPTRYGPAGRRGLIGSSLGGLVSYAGALRHPATWDFVASLSGTMGWGSIQPGLRNRTIIEDFQALSACPAATLYLDSGGGPGSGCVDADADGIQDDAPGAADNYCENLQLKGVLEALGCGPRLTYRWAPDARHDEAAWRARAPAILELFQAL
jgi:predicted alpha/beta superfamily hydrolase